MHLWSINESDLIPASAVYDNIASCCGGYNCGWYCNFAGYFMFFCVAVVVNKFGSIIHGITHKNKPSRLKLIFWSNIANLNDSLFSKTRVENQMILFMLSLWLDIVKCELEYNHGN